jgi:hypothetical protein
LLAKEEVTFDFESPVNLVDIETGTALATDPALMRDAYLQSLTRYLEELKLGCSNFRVDYHLHRLDEDYEPMLTNFLLGRLRRRRNTR